MDTGESVTFGFDRLLIATGVRSDIPNIPGVNLKNVFSILSLEDALKFQQQLETASTIGIIGAGYAGLEFAESLRTLGKTVRIFEREQQVMPAIDPDMAQIIEFELRRFGVEVFTGTNVLALTGQDGRVQGIKTASRLGVAPADLVLMDTGVTPNTQLTTDTDIRIGLAGGIAVDEHMETTVPGVFAAGNCAETFCPIRRRPVVNAIGTVAAKQGRIAGENLAGRRSKFRGSVGTTILKVFQLGVGRTGLSTREAAAERISCVSARIEADDRASYYPGTSKIWIKLIVERESRKVVGAQAVGYGDIARRIDVTATAISSGMTIDDLAQLDLAYAPPFGSLWDPLLVAAQAVMRRMD
jgi:NADPH-dependent 2,4-dienoyl-CoA reductase/sulfur reductase-like enzyme